MTNAYRPLMGMVVDIFCKKKEVLLLFGDFCVFFYCCSYALDSFISLFFCYLVPITASESVLNPFIILNMAKSREGHAQEMQHTIKSQVTRLENELKSAKTAVGESTTAEKEWLDRERTWHTDERRLREQASKATFELEALQREKSTTDSVTERETQRRLQELRDPKNCTQIYGHT